MAVENIPWMIQGGKHSAGAGRRVLFEAVGGAEGISSVGDMRVLQQAVATGSIKVTPGSAIMRNRYPGGAGEAYDGKVLTDTTVAIAANGSGSVRHDLVIARIDDWNVAGQQATPATLPTDTVAAFKLAVITGVASTVKKASELNLGYPAIALARIAIPAATSAITQAMIFDLREKAVPRRQRHLHTANLAPGDSDAADVNGEYWPNVGSFVAEVPEWATRAKVLVNWYGVKTTAASTRSGGLYARLGAGRADVVNGAQTTWSAAQTPPVIGLADDLAIPSTMRGQSITIAPVVQLNAGSGGYLNADAYTSVVFDIEWLEAPTEDA